jgi:protein tyrosine/serine phosphatase
LNWPGCYNVRDLGGLRTTDGREVRRKTVVRGDAVDRLSDEGWWALWDYGIRTVIDLRNDDERVSGVPDSCKDLEVLHLPLDGVEDTEFWGAWVAGSWDSGPQFASTPLYYRPHLERMPERSSRVISAIANAAAGGILFHCVRGRDRTGLIAMLLLSLLGVHAEEIASDYCVSDERLVVRDADLGEPNITNIAQEYLSSKGTSASKVIVSTLSSIDVRDKLRIGGLSDADVVKLQERLLV